MVQDASQRRRASRASSELISTTFVVEVLAFIAKIPVRRGQFPDRQANRTLTSMTPIPSISAEMTSPFRPGHTPAGARQSGEDGKSVPVRVDLGGRRSIKKK